MKNSALPKKNESSTEKIKKSNKNSEMTLLQ